jgi:hypothetical protein
MRRMTFIGVAGLLVALACAACAPDRGDRVSAGGVASDVEAPTAQVSPDDDLLYVGVSDGIAALDPDSGRLEFEATGAVASGDWSVLWQSRWNDDETTALVPLDPVRGDDRAGGMTVDKLVVARLASYNGTAIALMPPRAAADRYFPEPREHTSITVARADTAETRTYELDGNFEPEAFSLDTKSLYVIQYFPALTPTSYQVRRLNLDSGKVEVVFDLDSKIQERMGGVAHTHVAAPDGSMLYTLYTDVASNKTFIHVLSLEKEWAHCIDLPTGISATDGATLTLALTPDRRSLVVADRLSGEVAIMDTESLEIVRSGNVGGATVPMPASAATDGELLYLGTPGEILVVHLGTLEVVERWSAPDNLLGIALSAQAHRLYLTDGAMLTVIDTQRGKTTVSFNQPVLNDMTYVGRNTAPLPRSVKSTTECAC